MVAGLPHLDDSVVGVHEGIVARPLQFHVDGDQGASPADSSTASLKGRGGGARTLFLGDKQQRLHKVAHNWISSVE